jgi:hypothetical protein
MSLKKGFVIVSTERPILPPVAAGDGDGVEVFGATVGPRDFSAGGFGQPERTAMGHRTMEAGRR